jgi:hypothetical protein
MIEQRRARHLARRRLTTLVLSGVVGLIGVMGVVMTLVLADGGTGQQPAWAPPSPGLDAPPPAEPEASAAPRHARPVQRPVGQPPGTIRLPQGGTAKLVRKELDSSGTLPVPNGVDEATWWGAGLDAPGGATVLAGHVNWKGAIGPFAELWQAAPDQFISVLDDRGRTWRYRVAEVVTVGKEELPQRATELFGQGGRHRLVLVTCGGRYVGGDTGYDDNRIVIATPA